MAYIYYLLNDNDEIVYIGQSGSRSSLIHRIADHMSSAKSFSAFRFKDCEPEMLNIEEAKEIMHYLPKYNKSIPSNVEWSSRTSAVVRFTDFLAASLDKKILGNKIYYKTEDINMVFDRLSGSTFIEGLNEIRERTK